VAFSVPSFATADVRFRKGPDLRTIFNVITQGHPNLTFSSAANMDITPDEFTKGALTALEVVSTHMAEDEDELDALGDQVLPGCLSSLQRQLKTVPLEKRAGLAVKGPDVFFSWLAEAHVVKSTGEVEIVFGCMHMPGYSWIRKTIQVRSS